MTSNASSALFDVNVWVALVLRHHNHNADVVAALPGLPRAVICRAVQGSLLRLFTNPTVMGANVCDGRSAWVLYERMVEDSNATFMEEPPRVEMEWKNNMSATRAISGNAWNDAYLAAFAKCAGIQLVTFDRGFKRFAGLDCRVL